MAKNEDDDRWERLLDSIVAFQTSYGPLPLVGGTASALYGAHRVSNDADFVVDDLRERYQELLSALDADDNWKLKRRSFGKIILGDFGGVETGLRQLRRSEPLETQTVSTEAGDIIVPTLMEMIRIKGFLILDRSDTRDYIDFAALSATAGVEATKDALRSLDACYRDVERRGEPRDTSPLMELDWRLTTPAPRDFDRNPPDSYRGIQAPWDDWLVVADQCAGIARAIDPVICGDEDRPRGPSV